MARSAARSLLALCVAGLCCAGPAPRITPRIAPAVEVNGRGALVYLEIVDRRASDTPQMEVVPLEDAISRALWRIGFRASDDRDTPRTLRIEIRDVGYQPPKPRTRRIHTRAAFDARAEYGKQSYEHLYLSEAEIPLPVFPGRSFAQEQVDLTVWDALQKMFADEALFAVLVPD